MGNETTLKINGENNLSPILTQISNQLKEQTSIMAEAGKAAENHGKSIESSIDSLKGFHVAYDILKEGLKVGIEIFKSTEEKYIEAEKTTAQLEAVIKSTGGAAGETAQSVESLADSLSSQTTFSKDAIVQADNMLLTFTRIGKDVFPQATETVLNMSQALGQDLKGSSIQLGKALNDPITGVTALHRVGVTFTDSQKDQIKVLEDSGKHLEAQKIILQELQTEFGGSAKSAKETFGGALATLNNTTEELQESVGKLSSKVAVDFVHSMTDSEKSVMDYLKSAEGLRTIGDIAGTIGGTFAAIETAIKPLGDVLQHALSTIGTATDKFKSLNAASQNGGIGFDLLKVAITAVGTTITIASQVVKYLIDDIVSLVKIFQDAGAVVTKVFKGDFSGAFNEAKKLGTDFVSRWKTNFKDIGDIITDTTKTFDKLNKIDMNPTIKAYHDAYSKIHNEIVTSMTDAGKQSSTALKIPIEKSFADTIAEIEKGIKDLKSTVDYFYQGIQKTASDYFTYELAANQNNAEKTKEIKQQQFIANKAISAVNIAMSTAEAIVKFLANPGGPAGVGLSIAAGVIGTVQEALVLAQPMPAFAQGGIIPGNNYSGDNVLIRANSGEGIFTKDQMKAMGGSGGGGHTYITHTGNIIANDPIEYQRKLQILQQRQERGRGVI